MAVIGMTRLQSRALRNAAERGELLASWNDTTLTALERAHLLSARPLYRPDGRLTRSKVWSITDIGREALAESMGEIL